MLERRDVPRTLLNTVGRISLDEHRTLPCLLFDRSLGGVRVALPDAESVPDKFVLTVEGTGEVLVCRTAWRKTDEIGARTDAPDHDRFVRS